MSFLGAEFMPDFIETQNAFHNLKKPNYSEFENDWVINHYHEKLRTDYKEDFKDPNFKFYDVDDDGKELPTSKYLIKPSNFSTFMEYFNVGKVGSTRKKVHTLMGDVFEKDLKNNPKTVGDQLMGLNCFLMANEKQLVTEKNISFLKETFKFRTTSLAKYLTNNIKLLELLKKSNSIKKNSDYSSIDFDKILDLIKDKIQVVIKNLKLKRAKTKLGISQDLIDQKQKQLDQISDELKKQIKLKGLESEKVSKLREQFEKIKAEKEELEEELFELSKKIKQNETQLILVRNKARQFKSGKKINELSKDANEFIENANIGSVISGRENSISLNQKAKSAILNNVANGNITEEEGNRQIALVDNNFPLRDEEPKGVIINRKKFQLGELGTKVAGGLVGAGVVGSVITPYVPKTIRAVRHLIFPNSNDDKKKNYKIQKNTGINPEVINKENQIISSLNDHFNKEDEKDFYNNRKKFAQQKRRTFKRKPFHPKKSTHSSIHIVNKIKLKNIINNRRR